MRCAKALRLLPVRPPRSCCPLCTHVEVEAEHRFWQGGKKGEVGKLKDLRRRLQFGGFALDTATGEPGRRERRYMKSDALPGKVKNSGMGFE